MSEDNTIDPGAFIIKDDGDNRYVLANEAKVSNLESSHTNTAAKLRLLADKIDRGEEISDFLFIVNEGDHFVSASQASDPIRLIGMIEKIKFEIIFSEEDDES